MNQPSEKHFQFRYALFPVNVHVKNDVLCVRYALKYFEIPISKLKYFYVDEDRSRELVELLLCYPDRKGRLKRERIFSDRNDPAFKSLVAYLSDRVKTGNLTGKNRNEVYTLMGSRQMEHIYIPGLLFGTVIVIAFLLHPYLLHGFDTEMTPIRVSQIARGELTSHFVSLRNPLVDLRVAVYEPTTPTEKRPLDHQWHPIFDQSMSRTSVHLLGRFDARNGAPIERPKVLTGMIRNITLERIPVEVIREMENQGLTIHPDAVYLHVGATPKKDLAFFLFIVVGLTILAIAVSMVVRNGYRRRLQQIGHS